MNQICVKLLTNWVTHVIGPGSGVQNIGHGHHGHIASVAAVVIFPITIGITTTFLLRGIVMSFVGFCRVSVVTINIHLSLGRSVVPLTTRGMIPLFDLETPREDPAAHDVITFERVPLAQVFWEE